MSRVSEQLCRPPFLLESGRSEDSKIAVADVVFVPTLPVERSPATQSPEACGAQGADEEYQWLNLL